MGAGREASFRFTLFKCGRVCGAFGRIQSLMYAASRLILVDGVGETLCGGLVT